MDDERIALSSHMQSESSKHRGTAAPFPCVLCMPQDPFVGMALRIWFVRAEKFPIGALHDRTAKTYFLDLLRMDMMSAKSSFDSLGAGAVSSLSSSRTGAAAEAAGSEAGAAVAAPAEAGTVGW